MTDHLTAEELEVLPRLRLDVDAGRYDAYRPEDVRRLLDIIGRADLRALATPSSVTPDLRAVVYAGIGEYPQATTEHGRDLASKLRIHHGLDFERSIVNVEREAASVTPSEPTPREDIPVPDLEPWDVPSEPTLDVERLATAICASREPPTTATADLFVDDDCRRLAGLVAAQYESMAEDARSPMGGPA